MITITIPDREVRVLLDHDGEEDMQKFFRMLPTDYLLQLHALLTAALASRGMMSITKITKN